MVSALGPRVARARKIPLTIVGAFLGAGKTTLLNHIIANADGRRFAFVVNDFGAINIDARLVVAVDGETIALSNGCICCVIRDDLVTEVETLAGRPDPSEHIIIESSGVAKPLGVVESLSKPDHQQVAEVQTILTLLDADQAGSAAAMATRAASRRGAIVATRSRQAGPSVVPDGP